MKGLNKSDLFLLLLILVSFVPGVVLYDKLPTQMPTHWNVYGQVDGYSSKGIATFLLPGINLAMYFLFFLQPRLDPKRQNYALFSGTYTVIRWALHLFMFAMYFITLASALRLAQGKSTLDISLFVPIGVSILFIIMGNYMGRFRHNYFIGIRTPWTLANEQVWQKTHRLGGKLFVLSGVLGLAGVFLSPVFRFILFMSAVATSLVIVTVYSYWLFHKLSH